MRKYEVCPHCGRLVRALSSRRIAPHHMPAWLRPSPNRKWCPCTVKGKLTLDRSAELLLRLIECEFDHQALTEDEREQRYAGLRSFLRKRAGLLRRPK